MNIPNMITIFRILLIPVYLLLFYSDMDNNLLYAGIVFLIAGFSDILDGYIARKHDMKTKLGAVLDPLADKLVVFTILISFTHKGIIPSWILIIMGLKEIILIVGAGILYLFRGKQVIPSNIYGKIATVLFYVVIVAVILELPGNILRMLFVILVGLNIMALLNYINIYKRL